jgi:parallel beta-helix repeat protein
VTVSRVALRAVLVGWILMLGLPLAVQAQTTVSLVSLTAYGNYHAGGVVAVIGGDTDRDSQATLEWRSAGGSFRPAQPLVRVDASHFVGSLFWLRPGQSYEVRVTLSDPDGVVGAPTLTAALATRTDGLPEPSLRRLYVAPGGNDANPGTSPALPLRTVQRAATLAQAGDLVLIRPGVYRESVTVARSGTAAQPIVFRGDGSGVVLDGADAAIAGGVSWSSAGGGVWSRVTGFPTGHVVTEAGRLFRYASTTELSALGAGAPGGFYFDGTRLFVKLSNGSSPSSHTMHVARFEDGFVVDGQSYVRIESIEIRHYGAGDYGKGVYLRYASDCTVRSCRIHEVGAAGVWLKGGDRNRIEDNTIWDTSIFGWPWDRTKGSWAEDDAILFTDDVVRGNVVRRNTVLGTFNGIAPCGATAPAGLSNETDVYDNVLAQHSDDGIEAEGHCSNVRLWSNRIENVHMAFAVAPAAVGPVYILRNVAYRFGNTRTSQQDGYVASALKINSGYPEPVGPLFLYHNTFLTDAAATDAVSLLDPGESTVIRARNNVLAGTRYALSKTNPVALDWNHDLLYSTDPSRFVWWEGTPYANLAALRAGTGQELNGLQAAPQLVDPAHSNFRPQSASPVRDVGLVLPGINDGYRGAGPDIGAYEDGMGFLDVPSSSPFWSYVDILAANGVAGGCSVSPPLYCPANPVRRDQMAIFLLRSARGSSYVPPAATGIFADVPANDGFAPWIEALYAAGVTAGCAVDPLRYCPAGSVTRRQMAIFLLRMARGPAYTPPAATGIFADVPAEHSSAPWIEQLYKEGITSGCATNPLRYCPDTSVTRGQMAIFLVAMFGLV